MMLDFKDIHVGMTFYHAGDPEVVFQIDDAHNIRTHLAGRPQPGKGEGCNLFCLVPGCELYRPVFDNAEESRNWKASLEHARLPDCYHDQNGCGNCKNCFVYSEYDEGPSYLCNVWGDRPPCGSVAMGEIKDGTFAEFDRGLTPEEYSAEYEKRQELYTIELGRWEEWAAKHAVTYSGRCSHWIQKPPPVYDAVQDESEEE